MTTAQKLGQRIRQLRQLRGYTQEGFEEASGLSPQYLSAIERGTKNVTLEVLERIAKGLQIELHSLFLFDSSTERPTKKSVERALATLSEHQLSQAIEIIRVLQSTAI